MESWKEKLEKMKSGLIDKSESAYEELFSLIPSPKGYGSKDVGCNPYFFGYLREHKDGTWWVSRLRYILDGSDGGAIPAIDDADRSESDTMLIAVDGKPRAAKNGSEVLMRVNASYSYAGVATYSINHENVVLLKEQLDLYKNVYILGKIKESFANDAQLSLDDVFALFQDWKEIAHEMSKLEHRLLNQQKAIESNLRESERKREELKESYEEERHENERLQYEMDAIGRNAELLRLKNEQLQSEKNVLIKECSRVKQELEMQEEKNRQLNRKYILREIRRRGIKYFVHFTRVDNLNSILDLGLCTNKSLREKGVEYSGSDASRFDQHSDAICLSVTSPNYRMFYAKRQEQQEQEWCVILLKPEYVVENDPLYYEKNAASADMKDSGDRRLFDAFLKLFEPIPDKKSPGDEYPSDPQAEVQVLQDLAPESICGIAFNDEGSYRKNQRMLSKSNHEIKIYSPTSSVGKLFFSPRSDYEEWK